MTKTVKNLLRNANGRQNGVNESGMSGSIGTLRNAVLIRVM
jgi:hypothetical protein